MAAAVRAARRSAAIATPFLTADVASFLVRACDDGNARNRRLLTALNGAAVEAGYLDPDAVEEFIAAGFEAKSLRNLHAKLLIADKAWALLGSGNLTTAGSNGGNAELGIVLDRSQAKTALEELFEPWWAAAEPLDVGYMRALRKKRPRAARRRRRDGRGGIFTAPTGVDLGAFSKGKQGSGYWLKILYGSEDRAKAAHWHGRTWVSDRHTERPSGGKPLREPSYRVGEHLVIYVSTGPRKACPAIVRVAKPPVFDPNLVAREASKEDANKYGWVTWVDWPGPRPR
jgi:phosphatidylserine/phosphatidylglycerophosphate/cardiolipin synthase-like enzyme